MESSNGATTDAPPDSRLRQITDNPPMWCSGSVASHRSVDPLPSRNLDASTDAAMFV
jgi:hypothetical protein